MNIQFIVDEVLEVWQNTMAWFASTFAATDLQTAGICAAVFIISALIVYLISVFGTRERTYEEAIEEQRRRNKALLQAKNDKNKKEKKFKKWGKKKEKSEEEKSPTVDDAEEKVVAEHAEAKLEVDTGVSSVDSATETKPQNQKKKGKHTKVLSNKDCVQQLSSSEETDERGSRSNSFSGDNEESVTDMKEEQQVKEELAEKDSENPESTDSKMIEEPLPKTESTAKEDSGEIQESETKKSIHSKSPTKKNKKSKSEVSNTDNQELTPNKVVSFLKSSLLSDEEIHMMLEILMNKQGGVGGWTKKNDPVPALKKLIQEKDEALETGQRLLQSANEKIKSLRQEFSQEKSRFSATERSLREKVSQQQQEMQNLHGRMQITHEQHVAEIQTKLQQMKTKLTEEHTIAVQRLKEENSQLQALNRMESEKQQRSSLEISRLQHELEQLHSARDQYDTHQAAMKQAQDDLHRQIQQLEKHIEQLVSSHQDEEFSYKQRINELSNKLQQAENARSSLVQELQNAQSVCSSLEADNTSLRQRLEEIKHQINASEQDKIQFQSRLEESHKQQRELAGCLDQLKREAIDLKKTKSDQAQHISELKEENETLAVQLALNIERESADGAEVSKQNGEVNEHISKRPRVIDIEEHDRIIQEKEGILQQLLDELERCKCEVMFLSKELEKYKNVNSEIEEKYQKTKDALVEAQRKHEQKVNEILKTAEKNVLEAQRKVEDRSKEMQNILNEQIKEAERALQESYSGQLKKAQKEVEILQKEADERIEKVEKAADTRVEELQESLYRRLAEVNTEAELKIDDAMNKNKQLLSEIEILRKNEKEFLKRIFPDIHISESLDNNLWLQNFEEQAAKFVKQLKEHAVSTPNSNELKNLRKQLKESSEDKTKLEFIADHYKKVLTETEIVLNKLQHSAEMEERNWKEALLTKERDTKNIICENEKLLLEKKTLEANLEELQSLKEMQAELIALQNKLQLEENEKQSLVQRFQEALKEIDNLRSKLIVEEKEKEALKSRSDILASNGSPNSLFNDVPVNDVNSNALPIKSEKRKKSRKRGGSHKK